MFSKCLVAVSIPNLCMATILSADEYLERFAIIMIVLKANVEMHKITSNIGLDDFYSGCQLLMYS